MGIIIKNGQARSGYLLVNLFLPYFCNNLGKQSCSYEQHFDKGTKFLIYTCKGNIAYSTHTQDTYTVVQEIFTCKIFHLLIFRVVYFSLHEPSEKF